MIIVIAFTVIFIVSALLYAQQRHYEFLIAGKKNHNISLISDTLNAKIKEFDETKKKVDALVLRAGFKL